MPTDNGVSVFVLIEPRAISKISGTDYNTVTEFPISPQVAVWPRAVDLTSSAPELPIQNHALLKRNLTLPIDKCAYRNKQRTISFIPV